MSKSETNSKSETQNSKTGLRPGTSVSVIGALSLGFVARTARGNRHPPAAELSDFVLRISDFDF
jgi:hypothetical protein